jgi:nitroreductase
MELYVLEALFQTRRSIRKWKNIPVPEDLITKSIELAEWSPNSGGKQTYHCYVISNCEKINAIYKAVQTETDYLATLCKADADRVAVERWQKNSGFFVNAPVLIAVSSGIYQSIADKIQAQNTNDARVSEINRCRQIASSRVQTVGAFVAHLLLALHAVGLGAVYMVGPTQAKTAVEKIIGMNDQEDFMALIPVGYPDEDPLPPVRKPVSDIATFLR